MRFHLGDVEVFFPYDRIYPEQYQYMSRLKEALDVGAGGGAQRRHCLLEMPTGTGKTVSLLSLITSYQATHKLKVGKLIYCTRTVPEMTQCIEELKVVMNYRRSEVNDDGSKIVGVCLSARRNMCIHPRVMAEADGESVDAACRSMTAPWVRTAGAAVSVDGDGQAREGESCSFFEEFDRLGTEYSIPEGVYTLEDLRNLGKAKGWCPYFMTRQAVGSANVVVFNYQYLLDPKVAAIVTKELAKESIVVFDEAHNIDSVCIEALSVYLDKRRLKDASNNLKTLKKRVTELKEADAKKLREEYKRLVNGLVNSGSVGAGVSSTADAMTMGNDALACPVPPMHLPDDVLMEAIPASIRRADLFVNFLSSIVDYLRRRLRSTEVVVKETPKNFYDDLHTKTGLEYNPLKFTYSRLSSLLRTLEITNLNQFNPLSLVADFATLLATYPTGFMCIIEPFSAQIENFREPVLQLSCLDASLAIRHVFERFRTVVITSGTLSPLEFYPKVLRFQPVISQSFSMSVSRKPICPMVVTRGEDNSQISSAYNKRDDSSVIHNYGILLANMAKITPDGIVCFFTSYSFMERVILKWNELEVLKEIQKSKLVFIETKDVVETTLALQNYKRACDCGRGAVFFSIARGKVAEGIDFDRQYGRCVIMFGIPFQYTKSHSLISRLEFLRTEHNIQAKYFLSFDALRQTSQCIGRVVRSKTDYGLVLLADARYNTKEKRDKLPAWVTKFLDPMHLNLSTNTAVELSRKFLKECSQPFTQAELDNALLTQEQIVKIAKEMKPVSLKKASGVFDWLDTVENHEIDVFPFC